ncbi:MAG TPA: ABC transporter permease [Candidatus Solibacter sp.]|nr:ABC transporter permease [Candidatus Solibacter sp.]
MPERIFSTIHDAAVDMSPVLARETIIRPRPGLSLPRLDRPRDRAELLLLLAWRDIKVRYKQTLLGATWALIQPLFLMVVFALFLHQLAGVPSGNVPYPIFVYAALVPWTFFSQAVTGGASSLILSSNLISKVYFPRILLPVAATLSYLLDFAIAMIVLVAMMFYYRVPFTAGLLWLPALVLMMVLLALSLGVWLAALNARYRDIRYAVPFMLQGLLFVSPVAYSAGLVPHRWQALYALNPLTSLFEGFRLSLLGSGDFSLPGLALATGVGAVLLIGGLVYFDRAERTLADII